MFFEDSMFAFFNKSIVLMAFHSKVLLEYVTGW